MNTEHQLPPKYIQSSFVRFFILLSLFIGASQSAFSILALASTAAKPPVFDKEATAGDNGIMLSEKGSQDLLILSDGKNSEAFEPAKVYNTIVLRCLVPYTQGEWKGKDWPLTDGSSELAPNIRKYSEARGTKVLEKLFTDDPKFCETFFAGMFGKAGDSSGNTLDEINGLAEDVYARIADLTKGEKLEAFDQTTPIGICLADLATVEFLNQLSARCTKR